jgi:hypothetical protein
MVLERVFATSVGEINHPGDALRAAAIDFIAAADAGDPILEKGDSLCRPRGRRGQVDSEIAVDFDVGRRTATHIMATTIVAPPMVLPGQRVLIFVWAVR